MLIWSGFGFLAALIPVAVFMPLMLLVGKADPPTHAMFGAAYLAGGLLTAGLLWWLGRRLNCAPGRELIDAKTGERLALRRRHALFWIPMQWWAIPYLLVALFGVASLFIPQP